MALSTFGHKPRITALYADLMVQWARQAVEYSRSVRLYNERVRGLRADRPGLVLRRRSARIAILDAPHEAVSSPSLPLAAPPSAAARSGGRARSPLTARQREIAALIAQGLTNRQIAARIVVSQGTVGNHVGHMLRRLGVKNRAQIAAWAIQHAAAESSTDGGALAGDRPAPGAALAGGEAAVPAHDLDGAGVPRRDDLGDQPSLLSVV